MESCTRRPSLCPACGSRIEERQYQMRAADEAHTSVFSCAMCPIDASRIRPASPASSSVSSYPRRLHVRTESNSSAHSGRVRGTFYHLRVSFHTIPRSAATVSEKNVRHLCPIADEFSGLAYIGYYHEAGPYRNTLIRVREDEVLSPRCSIFSVSEYTMEDKNILRSKEADGDVSRIDVNGSSVYVYTRPTSTHAENAAVVRMDSKSSASVKKALGALCAAGFTWHSITSFILKDTLSLMNNLSPRAWDSKRIQKKGALYSPKIDGERVYVIVFRGLAHVFSRGRGYPHIGCIQLQTLRPGPLPVFVDAENTVSHGMFLIDMLTDRNGLASPRARDYAWSESQFLSLAADTGLAAIRTKPHLPNLVVAERISENAPYPTDGVIALWPGTTTARKMKKEKSIELEVSDDMSLATSEGDVVFRNIQLPNHTEVGDIVEVRMKLSSDGKSVSCGSIFRRTDKTSANSTVAVSSVLSSFGSVGRDEETRRREVLMWCDSLRHKLLKMAMEKRGDKKVVMDVGTGTGQSLDALGPDRGVSYILVEPSTEKCEMLRRRTGEVKVVTDAREIMYSLKSLKSGLRTYLIANVELDDITSDEELMKFIHREIAFVSATFSAHFVVPQLYDISRYWSIPIVGCVYPYDGVEVGGHLVNCLGVAMKRESETSCSVKWGGDSKYSEPYTTAQTYSPFSSVVRGMEILAPPSRNLDSEVYEICSKVYAIHEL